MCVSGYLILIVYNVNIVCYCSKRQDIATVGKKCIILL